MATPNLEMTDEDIIRAMSPEKKATPPAPVDTTAIPKGYENVPGPVLVPKEVATISPAMKSPATAFADTGTAMAGPPNLVQQLNRPGTTSKSTLMGTLYPGIKPVPGKDIVSKPVAGATATSPKSLSAVPAPSSRAVYPTTRPDISERYSLEVTGPGGELRGPSTSVIPARDQAGKPLGGGIKDIKYDPGNITDLIRAERRGTSALPGGNVSQFSMDPESARLAEERISAIPAARESYDRALSDANTMEAAHGTLAGEKARQEIATRNLAYLANKYGMNLHQLQASHLAAQANEANAKAAWYQERGQVLPQQSKSYHAQMLLDYGKELTKKLYDPLVDESEKENIMGTLRKINDDLSQIDTSRTHKTAQGLDQLTPENAKQHEGKTVEGPDGKRYIAMQGRWVEKKANGGPVNMDTPYLVGERGPELFVPKMSGMIIPNHIMGNTSGPRTALPANLIPAPNNRMGNIMRDRLYDTRLSAVPSDAGDGGEVNHAAVAADELSPTPMLANIERGKHSVGFTFMDSDEGPMPAALYTRKF